MKRSRFFSLLAMALVLSLGVSGCKKTPKNPTPIPGARTGLPTDSRPFPPTTPPPGGGTLPVDDGTSRTPATTASGIATTGLETFEGMATDREVFKANTVYFDFDRSTVRPGEMPKAQDVGNYLKSNPANKLLIEGHCDERGTEEYNRALGERRALALREVLVNLGIGAERIRTSVGARTVRRWRDTTRPRGRRIAGVSSFC